MSNTSDEVVYQLDLTKEEALLIMALIGPTHGSLGFDIFAALANLPDSKAGKKLRDAYHARSHVHERTLGKINTDRIFE